METVAHASENKLPANSALEFCGVEDETARLKQTRSTSDPNVVPNGLSMAACCSSTSFGESSSSASAPRASPTKAVLAWEAGRERRAIFASNPRRSSVISAYWRQELSSLSKQAAAQE
ncbi:hypothetical protein T484DRAFT_1750390 [Baffinella frigidus]|nr:hypothetical protein T484DRAFT_1750390 [Cryptophyta sp. CCMP2293]